LSGEERMATNIEKIIIDSNLWQSEEVLPDSGQQLFLTLNWLSWALRL
jgi:hypothetical protein